MKYGLDSTSTKGAFDIIVLHVVLTKTFCFSAPTLMSSTPSPAGLETNDNEIACPSTKGAFLLENILGENHESVEYPGASTTADRAATGWDEEEIERPVAEGYCVECEGLDIARITELETYFSSCTDQPAEVECQSCRDVYCEVCFAAQHRKGSRKLHSVQPLRTKKEEAVKKDDKPTSPGTKETPLDGDESLVLNIFLNQCSMSYLLPSLDVLDECRRRGERRT